MLKEKIIYSTIRRLNSYIYFSGWTFATRDVSKMVKTKFKDGTEHLIDVEFLTFEKKYSDYEFELPKIMYHVAPMRYINKIARNGLVPKSKSSRFTYPDRVYFFRTLDLDFINGYGINKIYSLREIANRTGENEFVNDDSYAILKVKRNSLMNWEAYKNKKITFYLDPMIYGIFKGLTESPAIFTYNTIPPNMIEDKFVCCNIDLNTRTVYPHEKTLR